MNSFVTQHDELLGQISNWIDSADTVVQNDPVIMELNSFSKSSQLKGKTSDSVK